MRLKCKYIILTMNSIKPTVLIIDAHECMRDVFGNYISKNFNVVVKKNSLQAYAWLMRGNIPSSIVLGLPDDNQPDISFLGDLRTSGLFQNIPLCVLSHNNHQEFKDLLIKEGANTVFPKPFKPNLVEEYLLSQVNLNAQEINPFVEKKRLTSWLFNMYPRIKEGVTGAMLFFLQ